MWREELKSMGTAELADLRAEIEVLLVERSLAGQRGGGREVIEERPGGQGTLRRELQIEGDGTIHGPNWHLYHYEDTKTGKRRLVRENLGRELPEEYRS